MSETDKLLFDLVECIVEEEAAAPPPPPQPQQPTDEAPQPAEAPPPAAPTAVVVKTVKTPSTKKPKPPPPTELGPDDTERVLARLPDRKLPPPVDDAVALSFSERGSATAVDAPPPPPAGAAPGETVVPFPPPLVPPKTEEERLREEEARRKAEAARKERAWKARMKLAGIKDPEKRAREEARLLEREGREQDAAAARAADEAAQAATTRTAALERQLAEAAAEAERQRAEERKLRVVSCTPAYNVVDAALGGERVRVTFSHKPTPADAPGQQGWWQPIITPEPDPPGAWLLEGCSFVYVKDTPWRLATKYTVTFPPGDTVLSANGEHLAADSVTRCFTTPVCKVEGAWAVDGPEDIDPASPFVIMFNQRVDGASVAAATTLAVTDGGRTTSVALKRIDVSELAEQLPDIIGPHKKDMCVVLAPAERLPYGASLQLVVAPGVRSLEGPEPSVQQTTAHFTVAAKFALAKTCAQLRSNCGCEPTTISFTQPLYKRTAPAVVECEPIITPKLPAGGRWTYASRR